MLNFCAIDDDTETLNNLAKMLETIFMQHDIDASLVLKTSNADELLNFANSNKIDVLFLDIDLCPNCSGLDLAEKIRKNDKDCYFIFVSAYPEYVFQTFSHKTFDFIFKPFALQRIEKCVLRLVDDIVSSPKRFIRINNKNTIIDEREIQYIKRDGMKVVFHTKLCDYEIYSSISKIESKLPDNFVRCHKSFIANIDNITRIEPSNNLIYFNSSICDIGPKYKAHFIEQVQSSEKIYENLI